MNNHIKLIPILFSILLFISMGVPIAAANHGSINDDLLGGNVRDWAEGADDSLKGPLGRNIGNLFSHDEEPDWVYDTDVSNSDEVQDWLENHNYENSNYDAPSGALRDVSYEMPRILWYSQVWNKRALGRLSSYSGDQTSAWPQIDGLQTESDTGGGIRDSNGVIKGAYIDIVDVHPSTNATVSPDNRYEFIRPTGGDVSVISDYAADLQPRTQTYRPSPSCESTAQSVDDLDPDQFARNTRKIESSLYKDKMNTTLVNFGDDPILDSKEIYNGSTPVPNYKRFSYSKIWNNSSFQGSQGYSGIRRTGFKISSTINVSWKHDKFKRSCNADREDCGDGCAVWVCECENWEDNGQEIKHTEVEVEDEEKFSYINYSEWKRNNSLPTEHKQIDNLKATSALYANGTHEWVFHASPVPWSQLSVGKEAVVFNQYRYFSARNLSEMEGWANWKECELDSDMNCETESGHDVRPYQMPIERKAYPIADKQITLAPNKSTASLMNPEGPSMPSSTFGDSDQFAASRLEDENLAFEYRTNKNKEDATYQMELVSRLQTISNKQLRVHGFVPNYSVKPNTSNLNKNIPVYPTSIEHKVINETPGNITLKMWLTSPTRHPRADKIPYGSSAEGQRPRVLNLEKRNRNVTVQDSDETNEEAILIWESQEKNGDPVKYIPETGSPRVIKAKGDSGSWAMGVGGRKMYWYKIKNTVTLPDSWDNTSRVYAEYHSAPWLNIANQDEDQWLDTRPQEEASKSIKIGKSKLWSKFFFLLPMLFVAYIFWRVLKITARNLKAR